MGNKQPKLTPKEEARQNKRTVDRAIRHIEREQKKLQQQETKALADIKKLAQQNQHVSTFGDLECRSNATRESKTRADD